MRRVFSRASALILSITLLLTGCTSTLVRDDVKRASASNRHCAGSEWTDDSSIAVLPVPVVAFFVPHFDLHTISGEPYLNRCGDSRSVINREVMMNKTACIPAGLTRIVTLGIWQWCPAHVAWSADVLTESAKPAETAPDEPAKPAS